MVDMNTVVIHHDVWISDFLFFWWITRIEYESIFRYLQGGESSEACDTEEKEEKMQEIKLYHFTEGHYLKDQLHKKAQVTLLHRPQERIFFITVTS